MKTSFPDGRLGACGKGPGVRAAVAAGGTLAYVPQDSFLFSDTYRANLEFGANEPLDDAQLHALIEEVAMADEVAGFPQGLEQLIGERGVTLSGGQRQRVFVAQGLAQQADLLLLDEPMTGLDLPTRALILEAVTEERAAGRAHPDAMSAIAPHPAR